MKNEKGISLVSILIVLIIALIIVIGAIIFLLYNKDSDENNNSSDDILIVNDTLNEETSNEAFVLYDGVEIKKETGWINLFDNMVNLSKESEEKYNTKYYNYEKNKYLGESEGTFQYENGGYNFVEKVGKIAINKKYNAIPRTSTKLNEIPTELSDMMDYPILEIESIDLDGNGSLEYILLCGVNYEANQIGDGTPVASSYIMLLDSNYKKIADLVSLEDGFTTEEKTEESKVFLSLDDVIYIDIDEDNIMEIIIKIPTHEEEEISILKYENGRLEGKTNIIPNILPNNDENSDLKRALERYLTLYSLTDDGAPLLCSYDSTTTYGLQLYDTYEEMESNLEPSGKAIMVNGEQMRLYKTSIKFETYEKELLKYVSQELFEKQFTKFYKDIDGMLCVILNSGDGENYKITTMEPTNEENTFKVTCDHSVGENNINEEVLMVKFEQNNLGDYIVSDCTFE